ncbi:MAG: universal stress protein [Halomonas sp.]|nr:universal stress protein [Halomonas sp.]
MKKEKILIPLDGSEISRKILPHVCHFCDADAFELIILRAERVPSSSFKTPNLSSRPLVMTGDFVPYQAINSQAQNPAAESIQKEQAWDDLKKKLKEELQTDIKYLEKKGYTVSVAIHFGKPAEEIIFIAGQNNVSLIAMASHGRTGATGSRLPEAQVDLSPTGSMLPGTRKD